MYASAGLLIYTVEVTALDRPVKATITFWLAEYAGQQVTGERECVVDLQPGKHFVCGPQTADPPPGKPYYVNGGPGPRPDHVHSEAWQWLGDDFGQHVEMN